MIELIKTGAGDLKFLVNVQAYSALLLKILSRQSGFTNMLIMYTAQTDYCPFGLLAPLAPHPIECS